MQDLFTTPLRRAVLPALAVLALFAAVPAAQAADQQATSAQIDNALNWQAAGGTGSDAYAQVVRPDHVVHGRRTYR